MKKYLLLLTCLLYTPTLLVSCSESSMEFNEIKDENIGKEVKERETYANSFDESTIENQWASYGIGDPFIYRFNGKYYLYSSTKNKQVGVRAWKSSDLLNWEPCQGEGLEYGYVSNDPCTYTAYAPEVIYHNGTFYMTESSAGQGHYMLEAKSPEGPFVKTQDNFGESIDGSFFIDDDEQMYFLRAGNTGIRMIKMDDEMKVTTESKNISTAVIGGWTEGPYLLKKDGNYYLTFTGTNVTSDAYHIAYAFHFKDSEVEMFSRNGFVFADNLMLHTTNSNYKGLGHSSTVLGPNMDSYYIAYHSLLNPAGPLRRFNINRLMFSGTEMSVPYYDYENNLAPQMPEFVSDNNLTNFDIDGDFYLSNTKSSDVFSAEFNFVGADTKAIFSYVDPLNYSYIKVDTNNKVVINKIVSGNETQIASYQLKKNYRYDVIHSLRVSYSDNLLDAYFDNLNIIHKDANLSGGYIGYLSTVDNKNIGYTAFSNAAHDSSQNDDYKTRMIPSSTFDRTYSTVDESNLIKVTPSEDGNAQEGTYYLNLNGKSVAYKLNIFEPGYYSVEMRLPVSMAGKTVHLRIDNENSYSFKIPKVSGKEDEYITVIGGVAINKGIHYLTVSGNISFRNINLIKSSNKKETFTHSLNDFVSKGANYVNLWKIKNNAHFALSGNRQCLFFGNSRIHNVRMSVSITLDGETQASTAGVVVRANNPSFSAVDDQNSIVGYYGAINNSKIELNCSNYNLSHVGDADAFEFKSGVEYKITLEAIENNIKMYVDNKLILSCVDYLGPTHGYCGLYTNNAAAYYRDLVIEVL